MRWNLQVCGKEGGGTMRLRMAVSAAVLVLFAAAELQDAAAEPPSSCPPIGTVYAAGPDRLTMELLPPDALGSAIYTLWRFQARDLNGTPRSELRMLYSCPNGRGACSISPASRPRPEDGYTSGVVALNRDLSLVSRDDTPYALVLPGFAIIDWTNVATDLARDITYADRHPHPPDFDNRVVWRRVRCGPSEPRR